MVPLPNHSNPKPNPNTNPNAITLVERCVEDDYSEVSSDGKGVSDHETEFEQMEEEYVRIGSDDLNRYLEITTPVNESVVLGDMNASVAVGGFSTLSEEEQARLIRVAVMANVVRRNRKWVCDTYGVPSYVFKEHWSQYLETKKHCGFFFHRDEVSDLPP
jgi:hypothetical protein